MTNTMTTTTATTHTRAVWAKRLGGVLAIAALGGCAVYPAPGYGPYETYGQPYAVSPAVSPAYISGGVTYEQNYGGGQRYYGNPGYGPGYRGRPGAGWRDRDGDGVPNRVDRDRDGDGVRNRQDARPNNPNRR